MKAFLPNVPSKWSTLLLLLFLSTVPVLAITHVTTAASGGPGSLKSAIASAPPSDTIDFLLALPATI
jgi:hypothetical protein